ncbi:hypothetical protein RB195_020419 [Necator americanus]|uniref:Unspecific monooxygenase n=1 Tax=Necator americanus TaxID=51031 RepID=A0ABR1CMB8_NECAM
MITILVLFLFSSIALYLWLFYENVKRYPKGPLPLPIVGNLHSVNIKIFHEELARFSKDYGNVFTVWLPKPHVIIMDLDLIKEAFTKKAQLIPSVLHLPLIGQMIKGKIDNDINLGLAFCSDPEREEQNHPGLHIAATMMNDDDDDDDDE